MPAASRFVNEGPAEPAELQSWLGARALHDGEVGIDGKTRPMASIKTKETGLGWAPEAVPPLPFKQQYDLCQLVEF